VAIDSQDVPIGFMLLNDAHLEALFISPDRQGQGIGKLLTQPAMRAHEVLTVDVNDQNAQALGFYERLGFEITGRSSIDGQGRPYPLLHMQLVSHHR
jgi:putative acetyltransferase